MQQIVTGNVQKNRGQQRKRVAILKAAREEFLTSGFESSGVDAIAARAGVSKQTLYNHFGSKEALFSQVVDDVVNSVHDRIVNMEFAGNRTLSAHVAVLDASETFADFLMRDETVSLYRLALLENERHPGLLRQLSERAEAPLAGRLRSALVEAGMASTRDVEAAVSCLIGGIKQVTLWHRLSFGLQSIPDPAVVATTISFLVGQLFPNR
jgi:TetR/AcrR family transcriptional regulator of autoinduction and epiphytic fitness